MTLFGVDISNNNDGSRNTVDLQGIVNAGIDWIEAKVSEGANFKDKDWARTRDFCAANGVPCIGYHFVTNDNPAAQAKNFVANGGGVNVMLDFEAVPSLTYINQFWAVVQAFADKGVTTRLSYIPHWYWQRIGSPDLTGVPGLIASNYVTGTGYASQLYPGDNSPRWFAYGNAAPAILQYSSQAIVANLQTCDANAFRGTRDQLLQLLGLQEAAEPGVFMALTDDEQKQLLAAVLDIQTQLRGPNLKGWPQLGKNDKGQDLTLVDAIAEVEADVKEGK